MPPFTVKDLAREIGSGTIDPARLKSWDPKEIVEVKGGLPSSFRGISNARVRDLDVEKAVATYAATVEVVDRMGDLVLTKPRKSIAKPLPDGSTDVGEGFLTENHKAAGAPFLWSHLARDHAVGQVTSSAQKKIDTPRNGRVWSTLQEVRYLVDERIPHAVPTWILVEAGIARSVSVGFSSVLWYWPEEDMRVKLGMPTYGLIFLTSDQTELSQAQTPACQLALARSADEDKGQTERDTMEALEKAVAEKREVGGVRLTQSLVRDFCKEFPLGPSNERDVLRGRLDGFFDMGDVSEDLQKLFDARGGVDPEVEKTSGVPGESEADAQGSLDVETRSLETDVRIEDVEGLSGSKEVEEADAQERQRVASERARELDAEATHITLKDCLAKFSETPGGFVIPPDVQRELQEIAREMEDKAAEAAPLAVLGRLAKVAGISLSEDLEDVERALTEHLQKSMEPSSPPAMKLAAVDQGNLTRAFEACSEAVEAVAELYERAVESKQRGLDSDPEPPTFERSEGATPLEQSIIRQLERITSHLGIGGDGTDATPAADRKEQRSSSDHEEGLTLLKDLIS